MFIQHRLFCPFNTTLLGCYIYAKTFHSIAEMWLFEIFNYRCSELISPVDRQVLLFKVFNIKFNEKVIH